MMIEGAAAAAVVACLKAEAFEVVVDEDDDELLRAEDTDWFKRMEAEAHRGITLRVRRTNAGLTQAQLAEMTGLKVANISAMEAGKRGIGPDVARKLAKALNCPMVDLLRHKDVEAASDHERTEKPKKARKLKGRAAA
ncbi:MAG TPA: helix-turn-helix transcriptional regulator [Candidatus Xenobia bacterium]|jgi:ribosome-binding protein aMBF1 (putative translation factor)